MMTYEEELAQTEEKWRSRMSPASHLLFAEQDGVLVGTIGYFTGHHLKDQHVANIFGVYVRTDCRGQGIGKQLMNAVLADIKSNPELTKIKIGVNPDQQSAYAMYKKIGFTEIGRGKHELKVGDHYYDEIFMEMLL